MISWKKRLEESEVKILEVGWMIWEQLFFPFVCPAQYWQTCCCNRLVSQSITRGDSGHTAWLITQTPCHWHTELYNRTHSLIVVCTETHKHTAHKKFASSCPQKRKKSKMSSWSESRSEQGAESSRKRIRTGGVRGQLPWQPGLMWQLPNQSVDMVILLRCMLILPADQWISCFIITFYKIP